MTVGSFVAGSHGLKNVYRIGGGQCILFVKVSNGNVHFIRGLVS